MKDSYEYAGSFPGGLLGCLMGFVEVQPGNCTPRQLYDGLQGCAQHLPEKLYKVVAACPDLCAFFRAMLAGMAITGNCINLLFFFGAEIFTQLKPIKSRK